MKPIASAAADQRRQFLRPAAAILATWEQSQNAPRPVRLPEETWSQCAAAAHRLTDVENRGWQTAAHQMRQRLAGSLETLIFSLRDALKECSVRRSVAARPTLRSLVDDLAALDAEFDEVAFDLRKRQLWVVTPAIDLEGVELGQFKIRLAWSHLHQTRPYIVKALDPNPACGDSAVTHPHVRDSALCEGDGKAAIRTALDEGRLFDFFLLVRQILETYNSSSAYVRLAAWSGVICVDCGCTADSDDASYCQRCESDLCGDCVSSCAHCGRSSCGECRGTCRGCDGDYCRVCLNECDDCRDPFCSECLTDGRCDACRETSEEPDESLEPEESDASAPAADSEVHAVGVGEAGLSA